MLELLTRNWWALALRGCAVIIFGILALVWPSLTVLALVLLFGAFAFVDGIFAIIAGISARDSNERWWATILGGAGGIVIGLLTFFWPGATALALLYLVAAWAFVIGILHVVAAVQLRRVITGEWLMILGSILLIIFGLLLVIFPGPGALSLVWLIGS